MPTRLRVLASATAFALILTALAVPLVGQTGSAELLTVTPLGTAGGGEDFDAGLFGAGQHTISADNRFVVFSSASSQLVAGDLNNVQDVFVRDRTNGTTTLVSRSTGGTLANGASGQATISADGRYVAFISLATNLVPGDTNQQIDPGLGTPNPYSGHDVFVHDRQTGITTRASVSSTGAEAEFGVVNQAPGLSADGRFLAFASSSTNLAAGDNDRFNADIFVRDMIAGTTTRVSVRPDGAELIGADAYSPTLSADGRRVAFVVFDNTLAGPTPQTPANLTRGVYLRDLDTAQTILVSARPDGTPATLLISDFPAISANGRYVSFSSWEDLDPANPDSPEEELLDGPFSDVFVRDLLTSTTRRVSLPFPGGPAEESGRISSISADGRFVAYLNSNGPVADIVVRDMLVNRSRVLLAPNGTSPNVHNVILSLDGRWAFVESYDDLVPADTNNGIDAYLLPVPPPDGADLSLTLSASTLLPALGSNVTLTIGVANAGGQDASGVTVGVPLPAGLTYVSDNGAGAFTGTTWTIGPLASGASASLEIAARVDTLVPLAVTSQITAAAPFDPDSSPGNDSPAEDDQKTVTITPQAIDLALSFNANTTTPGRNSNVTLTLTISNTGVIAASGVDATLTLPAGLTHVTDSGGGTYDPVTGVWTIGTIAVGASVSHQIVARVTSASPIDLVAQVNAANETDRDSTPGNNSPTEDDQAELHLVPVDAGIVVNDTSGLVNANDGRCTLVEAIIAANTDLPSGNAVGECAGGNGADVIHLRALTPVYTFTAVHNVTSGFNGLPPIASVITIDGGGQTIQRSPAAGIPPFRLFYIAPGATLTLDRTIVSNGFAVDPAGVNALAYYGGGIFNEGRLTISGGQIRLNRAGCDGGGIMTTGPLTVAGGALVESNGAGCSGGGIGAFYAGAVDIADTTFRLNTAASGGGLYLHGTTAATLTRGLVESNTVSGEGGGIFTHNADANLAIVDSQVLNNVSTTGHGGGIANGRLLNAGAIFVPGGTMSVSSTTIAGNRAVGLGGGIANAGLLTVTVSRVENNVVAGPIQFCGGGIYSADRLTVQSTTIAGNQSFNGGGLCLTGPASVTGGTISGNLVSNVGGGVAIGFFAVPGAAARQVTLGGVTIASNLAAAGGGVYLLAAVASDGLTLDQVTLQANGASSLSGGGLYTRGGTVTLRNNTRLLSNQARIRGGGIAVEGSSGTCCDGPFTIDGGTIDGNSSYGTFAELGGGGGIAHFATSAAAAMTITGVTLSNNHAANGGNGGAIFNGGVLTVASSILRANDAQSGGGLSNGTSSVAGGPAVLTDTTIESNLANNYGGAIFAANPPGGAATGTTTINRGVIAGNRAAFDGGGVFLRPNTTVTLADTTLDANVATGTGGGVYNTGQVVIRNTTLSSNVADAGGGLLAAGGGTITGSTISGNSARLGGGLRIIAGTTDITNSTISGNSSTQSAGGIETIGSPGPVRANSLTLLSTTIANNIGLPGGLNNTTEVRILKSILAGNRTPVGAVSECTASGVPGAPITTFSFDSNILGQDASCLISQPIGEQRVIDPAVVFTTLIGPLANNGGPTRTHALLPGSFAIDSVSADVFFPCTVDQRGESRPVDGDGDGVALCDAGAFEQQTVTAPPTPVLTSLSPATAVGVPAPFIMVSGSGFSANSVALWNGSPRTMFAYSPTSARITLQPGDGVSSQDIATVLVTVRNSAGVTSNALVFTTVSTRVASLQSAAVAPGSSGSAFASSGASGGVRATLTNNGAGSPTATLTTATYNTNPTSGTFLAAGGYFDLQIVGADSSDSAVANFYYPSTITGAAEAALQLRYWTGTAWVPVVSSGGAAPTKDTTDNLDGVPSGGRFAVTFDASSTPPITALGGTVFAIGAAQAATRIVGSGYNSPELPAYRATFSVDVSGLSAPAGALRYSYARTRMNFASGALTAFTVSGNSVTLEGAGTVNGASGYTFTATASAASPNTFALVIRRDDGSVYYSAPALPLAGGSFTITQ